MLASRPGTLAIYLTDGHGSFPSTPPDNPFLWVVTPGGLPSKQFPFGEVARLIDRN
jgi:predicted metal-dependent peptidase